MKPIEDKKKFIQMRAAGQSYPTICKELHISPNTCKRWLDELQGQIDELKQQELAELAEQYGMLKEARIRGLGEILRKIDEALAAVDFSVLPPDKLLDYKLKYTEALKEEYLTATRDALPVETITAGNILIAVTDLLNKVRAGEVTTEQAHREGAVLAQLLKAYDTVEVKAKIEELEILVTKQEEERRAG